MPNSIQFKTLTDDEVVKSVGKLKSFSGDLPKKVFTPKELSSKFKTWQASFQPAVEQPKLTKIAAVSLKAKDVEGLRAINESATPTAEAIVGQKMGPDKVIGTLFSSLSTLEYTKMESEFKSRMKAAATDAAKAKVKSEWDNVVSAGVQAFGAAGLKGLKEANLNKFSEELSKNKANFNAIVNIANTGLAVRGSTGSALSSQTVLTAGFVTQTGLLGDFGVTAATTIPNLCSRPFAEGNFTKHFHKGFSLVVSIPYWCPTWTNPFRTCRKNVTLAGLSLDLNVQVGYRVTCCGATAFGQASAQACATIIGISFCAGCTAKITGVAGIGRTGSGSNCVYGLGINAQLTCTFGGITVLNVQAPFGFNVSGPCPPAGLC
jgi:hypothetical protein